MDVEGTVKKVDIDGGVWQLRTAEGQTFQLVDPPKGLAKDGLRVRATLERARGAVGIGMTAPYVRVTQWKKA